MDDDSDGDDLLQSPMCSQGSQGQGRAASAYTTPLKSRLTGTLKAPAQSPLTPVWTNLAPDDPASAFFGFDDSPKPKPRCVAPQQGALARESSSSAPAERLQGDNAGDVCCGGAATAEHQPPVAASPPLHRARHRLIGDATTLTLDVH